MSRAFRYERFGGIVQLERPSALVFVDRDRARRLGMEEHPLWQNDERVDALLSGPLEAHLQLTNRCTAGCQGCYTGATPQGAANELGLEGWKRAVDALAERGVFHLALGGGESATLPWLGEVAQYARSRGLVPNLTTSGLISDEELDRLLGWMPLFGQVNISMDGVGETYARVRGFDGFARADRALVALRKKSRNVGINCVVTRQNYDELEALFAYARKRRIREIELLRFKPSGRGTQVYAQLRCTDEQHRAFMPLVLALAKRYRRRVRLDCSYTPMVAHHRPPPELLRWFGIYGCAGGDLLIGAKASGAVSACSFAPPEMADGAFVPVEKINQRWQAPESFAAFRAWPEATAPCKTCEYHALCRGGCRVVSLHVAGTLAAPDPECPRVQAHRATAMEYTNAVHLRVVNA